MVSSMRNGLSRYSLPFVAGAVIALLAGGAISFAHQRGGVPAARGESQRVTSDDVTVTELPSPCVNPDTGTIAGEYCFKVDLAPGISESTVSREDLFLIQTAKECALMGEHAESVGVCTNPQPYVDGMNRLDALDAELNSQPSSKSAR